MIKIGDFVTQYSAGYWQLIDLKPKIADEDYTDSKGTLHKKGDIVGEWAILKKAFTPKMKPNIYFNYTDSSWLKPISNDILDNIKKYFLEHPNFKYKFDNAVLKINPSIVNCWIEFPEEKEEDFRELMHFLPLQYTMEEFWHIFCEFKKYISKPPTKYLLNFLFYPWDMDKQGNIIFTGCNLEK